MILKIRRRRAATLIAAAVAAAAFAPAAWAHDDDDLDDASSLRRGKLFMSSNAPTGNEVIVYARSATGPATLLTRVATQGTGTGGGLGSQGAVTLSGSGRWLFVVNAGSNTISTFEIRRNALALRSVVDSGGLTPTSVTESDGIVYVLNAGGSGNVTGFRNHGGMLTALPGAVGTLSADTGTAPAQVGFSNDGELLVVTERNTNRLTSWRVRGNGSLQQKTVTASSGAVPFGFAFTRRDTLVVSEAAGSSVSSYRFADRSATPITVTASLGNGQGAACWIAVTPDGKLAFSANASTSTVSSFGVARSGELSLLGAAAATTGPGAGALDMAVTPRGDQLHVFASRALQIASYRIGTDGTLTSLGSVAGVPAGAAGLAAN
jgi:6-phosphogluconolactonase (cycloisomerase 2 family)